MAVISRRKYPFLFRVSDQIEIPETNAETAHDMHGIRGFNKIVRNGLGDVSIFLVSQAFTKDANNNYPKLHHLCPEIEDGKYCLLVGNDVFFVGKTGSIIELHVTRGYDVVYWGVCVLGSETWAFQSLYDNLNNDAKNYVSNLPFAVLLFMQFADKKVKLIPPKGRVKETHCKYKSDLPFEVGRLDELWYTEVIQGHPFVVRGHLRMQACGAGLKDRKPIWISEHMKNGYTKGAYKDA